MRLSELVSLSSWLGLIIILIYYGLGYDVKSPYVPVAMVVLFVIGLIGGIAQSMGRGKYENRDR